MGLMKRFCGGYTPRERKLVKEKVLEEPFRDETRIDVLLTCGGGGVPVQTPKRELTEDKQVSVWLDSFVE